MPNADDVIAAMDTATVEQMCRTFWNTKPGVEPGPTVPWDSPHCREEWKPWFRAKMAAVLAELRGGGVPQ